MKRVLFFLLCAMCLVACQKNTMTIIGKIDPELELNGKEVKLVVNDGEAEQEYFAEIADNGFKLTKPVPYEQFATINIADMGDFTFVLEKGVLNLEMEAIDDTLSSYLAHIYVSGTPNNDIINRYNVKGNELESALRSVDNDDEAQELYDEFAAQAFDEAMTDITKLGNEYIFTNIVYDLSLEQREKALAGMTQEQLSRKPLSTIAERTKAQLETAVGKPYTDITFTDAQGNDHQLSEYVGQTDFVLLDIWATWCPPCRALLPKLAQIYHNKNKKHQLQIVSLSVDNDKDTWTKFLTEHKDYSWIQMSDTYDAAEQYGVMTIPTTVLIDINGNIVARNISEDELKELLIK